VHDVRQGVQAAGPLVSTDYSIVSLENYANMSNFVKQTFRVCLFRAYATFAPVVVTLAVATT
jgi:hypothetical protein